MLHSGRGQAKISSATSAATAPMTSTSSSISTHRTRSPLVRFEAPSPSSFAQVSHSSAVPLAAENASTQLSPAPSCKPSLPDKMKRYQRTTSIPRKSPHPGLRPGKQSLNRPEVPEWNSEVHPEGALFYYRKKGTWVILTDTDLTVKKNLEQIDLSVNSIFGEAGLSLQSDSYVLVVELDKEDPKRTGGQECLYYFADHAEKLLFWVHEYKSEALKKYLCAGVKYATESSHIKCAIEAQYWLHCERFSNVVPMRLEYLVNLRETLIHASTDMILSDTSVSPFSPDDLLKMLDVVSAIESSISAGPGLDSHPMSNSKFYPHSMSAIARMMRLLTHSKFLNFYGQVGARLNADQSIYTKKLASEEGFSSPVFYTLNLLLLTAPRKHIRTLRGIYVDHVINASRWKGFISNLRDEWGGYTVFSTVMLAVDISFLAVPGVINGTYQNSQTLTATTIYISTILSLGTLVVSVLLADQIRRHGIESLDEGAAYMTHMTNSVLGIEAMAVMYSLPYALLVWSMLAFAVALSVMMFSSMHNIGRVMVMIFFVITVILASWPITCGRGRRAAKDGGYHTH
ncbi:hypothetical protein PAXRUDRAFT_132680 [Paxillus rubicundulus Ve08.2h10]|uniref:Uncharacterized protein n=1 Tax=Paxillus rubicundulus Ve08.2h10 TaxID=930991 RepID=A0A0D0E950_9AGAM|nr:hypothetical protein PAXRUDRAFT_132680 [Paxillus rubicundulus Ve08.2h10]